MVGQGLMLSSFDYAMGRATYMPSIIAGILKTTAPWLTREQREYVTSTIRERVAEHTAGMECDEATWLDLADAVDKMAGEPGDGRQWAQADVDEAVLFPAFKDRLGINDWWCMVCSAQRYDYRGDGRLAISDYTWKTRGGTPSSCRTLTLTTARLLTSTTCGWPVSRSMALRPEWNILTTSTA